MAAMAQPVKKATTGKENAKGKVTPITQPVTGTSAIANKAMLVRLTIHYWDAHVTDQQATEEVAQKHGAEISVGKYRKLLIPRSAMAKMQSAHGELRREHYFLTLPWDNEGYRILPSAAYFTYKTKMAELEKAFLDAVKEFAADYHNIIKDSAKKQGTLYRPEDYPPIQEIVNRMGVSINVRPIPSGKDFRCDVGDDEVNRIRHDIEQEAQNTLKAAMQEPWKRLQDVVGHMSTRLKAYDEETGEGKKKSSFRDSLVANIQELVEVLPVLNITGDKELTNFVGRVQAELLQYPAQFLRCNPEERQDVAKAADDILAKMAAYLGEEATI